MKVSMYVRLLALTLLCFAVSVSRVKGQSITKLVDHGPDGEKLTFVVLGDGYNASEQQKYAKDVNRLVVNGVFGQDFYKKNFEAFNLYRIDLVSKDSGVSNLTKTRDTALKV